MSHPPRIAALLVAAGTGSRLGAETPKQFLAIAGRPVIRHAAEALAREATLIQPVGDAAPIMAALAGMDVLPAVPGGATRQDSVRAGLEALAAARPRYRAGPRRRPPGDPTRHRRRPARRPANRPQAPSPPPPWRTH